MPFPVSALLSLTSTTWPLPDVLALVVLAMAIFATLGLHDLLSSIERIDPRADRRRPRR
jgi:hypothetical protein